MPLPCVGRTWTAIEDEAANAGSATGKRGTVFTPMELPTMSTDDDEDDDNGGSLMPGAGRRIEVEA